MTNNFGSALARACNGRVGFLGIGNTDRGDDAAGIVLGRRLRELGVDHVYESETTPERVLPALRDGGFDSVVFLDAVDMSMEPGAVAIFDAEEIVSRFPQVSTHKLSLATLARLVSDGNSCRVWLVGIQPESIEMNGTGLGLEIENSVQALARAIANETVPFGCTHQEQVCR